MPRPPVLPLIDWKSVFEGGKPWAQWLEAAESATQAEDMRERLGRYQVPAEAQQLLDKSSRKVHVVAIAEDWCGDVIKHAPVIAKIAEVASNVELRFITREQHPEVFVRFLTNGGEAIPKFVFLNSEFVECGNWGPMPDECRRMIARGKAMGDVSAGRVKVREFYENDPEFKTAFKELCALVELASTESL